jgi:hypothetical protein
MDKTNLGKRRSLGITAFQREVTPGSTRVWVAADDGRTRRHGEPGR